MTFWEETMEKEIISTDKAFVSKSPLSQAIKVGNLLFVSGQVPVDSKTMKLVSEDFVVQAKFVLESVKAILLAAGSSPDKAIKTTVFLTDIYVTFPGNE